MQLPVLLGHLISDFAVASAEATVLIEAIPERANCGPGAEVWILVVGDRREQILSKDEDPAETGRAATPGRGALLPDSKLINYCAIAIHIRRLQVVEQPSTLSDHSQKTSTRMVILGVNLEMIGQIADLLA